MPVSKKPRKKTKSRKKSQTDNVVEFMPTPNQIEGLMKNIFGTRNDDGPIDQAQDLIYEAWECTDRKQRISKARKALQISPLCVDAYNLLAEEDAKTLEEAFEYFQRGVQAGEEVLGPQGFEEYAGHFWGFHETRPYMRARAGLGEALWEMGKYNAAIDNFTEMLELNPGDNQGIRYILAAKLLEIGRMDDLKSLLETCADEFTADIQYTRALLAYFEKFKDAKEIATLAWKTNNHVPGMLSGRTPMIKLQNYITMGGKDEASSYVQANIAAWKKIPGSIEWLEDITSSLDVK